MEEDAGVCPISRPSRRSLTEGTLAILPPPPSLSHSWRPCWTGGAKSKRRCLGDRFSATTLALLPWEKACVIRTPPGYPASADCSSGGRGPCVVSQPLAILTLPCSCPLVLRYAQVELWRQAKPLSVPALRSCELKGVEGIIVVFDVNQVRERAQRRETGRGRVIVIPWFKRLRW